MRIHRRFSSYDQQTAYPSHPPSGSATAPTSYPLAVAAPDSGWGRDTEKSEHPSGGQVVPGLVEGDVAVPRPAPASREVLGECQVDQETGDRCDPVARVFFFFARSPDGELDLEGTVNLVARG
jgi:hypothetical protein